jgi:hypothetical protein
LSPSADCDRLIGELERSCLRSDAAITASAWDALREILDEQRRLTHALAMAIARSQRFGDGTLRERIERVANVRDLQSKRVSAAHDRAGARLRLLSQIKTMRRSLERPPSTGLGHLDTLQ